MPHSFRESSLSSKLIACFFFSSIEFPDFVYSARVVVACSDMLISAVHEEDGHEGLNLLMVDDRIPAGAKLY